MSDKVSDKDAAMLMQGGAPRPTDWEKVKLFLAACYEAEETEPSQDLAGKVPFTKRNIDWDTREWMEIIGYLWFNSGRCEPILRHRDRGVSCTDRAGRALAYRPSDE